MSGRGNRFIVGGGVEWGRRIVTVVRFVMVMIVLKKFGWGGLKEVMEKGEGDMNKDIEEGEEGKINGEKVEEENRKRVKESQD
ncbi:F0F1 ATP synthase subunit B family protein, partial [Staphylococcus epidermidis]|uniref:F0F1 ATP synthase subunit B family protein n=1 Tax=Staphylococcus epidermidis TaxID=1282 RepID=UPI003F68B05A